ncbi:MAG TPA: UDP-N-acetylglucosamine 2-epimerase (non-hydrolyzing) [Rhizomicrobium sp.]|nr:UDP-N-acetylglucosamine 2-epimerase (non-hydrolyzing) [Rhizomicrobium sp.]
MIILGGVSLSRRAGSQGGARAEEVGLAQVQGIPSASRHPRQIVTIVGARPQFVKAFPLSREFRLHDAFDEILVHTGQHFDWNMSDVFFAELGLEAPRYNLNIHGGSHGTMTGRMLHAIEEIVNSERPAGVLVYGDTNSTLAGALAAAKCGVPVIHIEAGLRSYNRRMPEEVNRVVVDHLSSFLLCPTLRAVGNLTREGITSGVHRVGDLMFDAVKIATPLATQHSGILERLGLRERSYAVATFHRQENLANRSRMAAIVTYLRDQSQAMPLIVPLHPRTRDALENASLDFGSDAITTIAPLGYLDMCLLVHAAAMVFTDSGGLQREAYFHRVPCVTLRDETEWVETVECGWNRFWTSADFLPRREIPELEKENTAEAIFHLLDRELA